MVAVNVTGKRADGVDRAAVGRLESQEAGGQTDESQGIWGTDERRTKQATKAEGEGRRDENLACSSSVNSTTWGSQVRSLGKPEDETVTQ